MRKRDRKLKDTKGYKEGKKIKEKEGREIER